MAARVVATAEANALPLTNAMGAKNSIGASLFVPRPWWQVDNDGDEIFHFFSLHGVAWQMDRSRIRNEMSLLREV